jgi:mannose-6-phosphate isomerase-like protein (cupin superfamily)
MNHKATFLLTLALSTMTSIGAMAQTPEVLQAKESPDKPSTNLSINFNKNIMTLARENTFYRREVVTGSNSQIVLMNVHPKEEIGEATNQGDQILVFVAGQGESILSGKKSLVTMNSLVFVPAGNKYNFINTGKTDLKLYIVYAPPVYKPGTAYEMQKQADTMKQP